MLIKLNLKFRNIIKISALFFCIQVLGITSSSAGTAMDLALSPHYITSDLMNEIRVGKLGVNAPVSFGNSYQMTPLCGVIRGAIEWQTLEDIKELIDRGADINSACNPLAPTSAPLDYYFQSTSSLGKTYVALEEFLIAQGAKKRIDQVDSTQWDKDKNITKVQQDVVDKDIKDLADRAKANLEEAQQAVDTIERRKAAMDSLLSADTLMSVIKVVGVAAEGYVATKNATNEVLREAEVKQAYESSVRESSSDSSSSSSSSSNSNNSKKPEKASDANPYQNNPSWTLYSQAFAGAVNSREATCSKAKSYADREMAREVAIGKVRFVAVSSCVCGHGDLTKTSIDQVWGCAIYVQKKSIYKDGPADTMSR
ncbi:MAG: hypothetical protein HOP21_07690 [Methylotenera sp.]|nr:hypothetical protein [Methylotenera sp.]